MKKVLSANGVFHLEANLEALTEVIADGGDRFPLAYREAMRHLHRFINAWDEQITGSFIDTQKEIWEGWTVQNIIDEMIDELDMIMTNRSYIRRFTTLYELARYIRANQPYIKIHIPEVEEYFARRYFLDRG